MNTKEFRDELTKIMPGYKWTVERPYVRDGRHLEATGIQTSGYNRMSTLKVERRVDDAGGICYKAYISGYGKRANTVSWAKGETLARALRSLQEMCDAGRAEYAACVASMQSGRGVKS